MKKTYFLITVEPVIQNVINSISLCSAISALFSILVTAFFRRQILNRVTLRFQGLIALIDIVKHITFFNITTPSGNLCVFIGFFRFFIDHMYVFVNVLIAINMQLIYIHGILPKPVFEILYVVIATGAAFVIDLIPLGSGAYGRNSNEVCYLKQNIINRYFFKVYLLYVTLMPGLIYCLMIFAWVIISLYRRRSDLEEKFPSKELSIFGENVNGRDFIRKLYFRMGLYPISCIISFFPYLISNIYFDIHGEFLGWMYFFFRLCNRLTGFMNMISLLYDPHFQLAIKSIKKNGFNNLDSFNLPLKELGGISKEDEEFLIKFPGEESIRFEDYVKFL